MKQAILLITMVFTLASCANTTNKFVYPNNHRNIEEISINTKKTVAVIPFEDLRDTDNRNRFLLYLIPLVPYASADYNRPDAANMFLSTGSLDMDVSEDLAKASAYSLNKSNLFKDVYFTFGSDKRNADYILEGEVRQFKYEGNMYSYGVSILAPYLWLLGAPMGSSTDIVEMKFKLLTAKDESLIWSKKYFEKDKITQGLYYDCGEDVKGYSMIYQKIMNDVIKDLEGVLNK